MENNDSSKYIEFRKKRVKFIKRFIVFFVAALIIFPDILCGILFIKINKTQRQLDNLGIQLSLLSSGEMETEEVAIVPSKSNVTEYSDIEKDIVIKNLPDSEEYAGYKRIYLTFDDGPSIYTDELLDLLDELDVKATFFVLAQDGYEDEYKRIVNEGHTLGIHSYKHVYSDVYANADSFANDIDLVYDYVTNVTGVEPRFYRFPGGSSNTIYKGDKDDLFNYLDEKNLVYVDWNVASNDSTYGGLSSNTIANNVLNGLKDKDDCVILLHDANDKHSSVEAVRLIVEKLKTEENVIFLPITDNTTKVQHVTKSE